MKKRVGNFENIINANKDYHISYHMREFSTDPYLSKFFFFTAL